jgi:predicted PurR-regulated permease PerM
MALQNSPSHILRVLLGLAATAIILGAMRLAADIVNPILLGLVLALLLGPLYGWLRRKISTKLALPLLLIIQLAGFAFLFYLFARSAAALESGLSTYATQLDARVDQLVTTMESANIGGDTQVLNADILITFLSSVIGSLFSVVASAVPIILLSLFFVTEGGALVQRAKANMPADNPQLVRLLTFGTSVVRQFGLRAIVNAITGFGFALLLALLGVDYAALWGVLTFFLSYIPYIGIVVAGTPATILAFAEFGAGRALLVIAALTIVNVCAENLLAPSLMGRGLNLSTTVTFVGFMFWLWLLGGPGAFLAMPLTVLVILLLDSYPETRWLARTAMRGSPTPPQPAPVTPQEPVILKGADDAG